MTRSTGKIRLYVDAALAPGASVALNRDQAHYLGAVMRRGVGDDLLVFNGADGEWRAEIAAINKRQGVLVMQEQTRPQTTGPDVWLMFAPIKKARTDFIVEKAAEMGVSRIMPVFTQHTNAERVRGDRLRAHAVEAAEQCGLLWVPGVEEPAKLSGVLDRWENTRRIMFCDETADHGAAAAALGAAGSGPWAILIGPEGGFSKDEVSRLRARAEATPVSLGPRILRADTAAVAALTLWQTTLGDWR
ncbi:MAG: 16S rRNA (uracil(1498)-N(3))-methyltransferase [Pikeienuella sp.]